MLKIVQSPDVEQLADAFFHLYQTQWREVFRPAQVIVPNLALGDWLEQRLARQTGIASRLQFSLWREFIYQAQENYFERQYPLEPLPLPLSSSSMRWMLFAYLLETGQGICQDPHHVLHLPLQTLLNGLPFDVAFSDAHIQRLWSYAQETAYIFNDYLAQRSDWLDLFSQAEPPQLAAIADEQVLAQMPDWLRQHYQQVLNTQAFLWRTLFAAQATERAALQAAFAAAAQSRALPLDILPPQLFIFMPQDMDAEMLNYWQWLGQSRQVYVFHHNISNAHFGDIVDSRWLRQLPLAVQEEQHYSSGHLLVSRLGKALRQRWRLLDKAGLSEQIQLLDPQEKPAQTLLKRLQADMRRLDDAVSISADTLLPHDDSLQIHGCHGLLRQLEVLRGEIVRWLNADSSRRLADILLVLPNLAAHKEVVRGIFPQDSDYDGYRLPTRLTGVSTTAVDNLWQALGGIYALAESEFSFNAVKEWLLLPDNCAAYGISHEEMLHMTEQLYQAGFRRGFDEAHWQERLDEGDRDYRFSFCYALDRLVAAYAMPSVAWYAEKVVPSETLSSDAYPALNALCHFAQQIYHIRAQRQQRYDATAALEHLRDRLQQEYAVSKQSAAYQAIDKHIRNVIYQLAGSKAAQHKLPKLPLNFIVRMVAETLNDMQVSAEPSGVMTIGQLHSLPALPYRLIVFLGAEEGEFPAQDQDRRYHLIDISTPRLGDRSRKQTDLHAFLQLLCAAQDSCWLFYTAKDPIDGEARLPPAPVQEVLSYLIDELHLPEPAVHQLHAADPLHPDESPTHPAPLWQRLRHKLAQDTAARPKAWLDWQQLDFSTLPSHIVPSEQSLPLSQLIKAFQQPLQTYLRLHDIAQHSAASTLKTREPLLLDTLEQWQLNEHLLRSDVEPQGIIQSLPLLPIGRLGKVQYQQAQQSLAKRRAYLLAQSPAAGLTPCSAQVIEIEKQKIHSRLPHHAEQDWLRLHSSKDKPKYCLQIWLEHLLWQAANPLPLQAKGSTIVNFNTPDSDIGSTYRLVPLSHTEAAQQLAQYLAVYQSMAAQIWLMPIDLANKFKEKGATFKVFSDWLQGYEAEQEAWQFLLTGAEQSVVEAALQANDHLAQPLYQPLFAAFAS